MFLSAALVTKSAFAAWQADGAALFAVGGIAQFAVAAAIHFRTRQQPERARAAEVQKPRSMRGSGGKPSSRQQAFMSSQFVTKVRRARPSGVAFSKPLQTCCLPRTARKSLPRSTGLAENGESLSMRCAGRIAGETYAVN